MISNPAVIAIYFYDPESEGKVKNIFNNLRKWNDIEWIDLKSSIALRITFEEKRERSEDIWNKLYNRLEKTIEAGNKEAFGEKQKELLGKSILYFGVVDGEFTGDEQREIIENGLNVKLRLSSELHYGRLWQVRDYHNKEIRYAILSSKSIEQKVKDEFIYSDDSGFIKIESHLHMVYDHTDRYKRHRRELMSSMDELEIKSREMIKLGDKEHKTRQQALDEISVKYADFTDFVSWASKILNTVQMGIRDYKIRYRPVVKGEDQISCSHIIDFEDDAEQIKYDLNYCQSTINSVSTGLELLRSIDSGRIQTQGMMQRRATEIIGILFLFFSSVEIWHFFVEKSVWEQINPFAKLVFGFTLAITITLLAYSIIEKNWNHVAICLIVILIAFGFVYWVTISSL